MNKALQNLQLSDILDLPIPGARGRAPKASGLAFVRNLNEADASCFGQNVGAVIRPLAKLRQRHHHLARLLAEGIKHVEASAITGYSQSSISILLQDPAFQELVEHYSSQKAQIYLDVHERLAQLGTSAMEELQERIEESPDKLSVNQLESIIQTAFDRSVAPLKGGAKSGAPGGASVSVKVEFVTAAPPPAGPILDLQVNRGGEDEE